MANSRDDRYNNYAGQASVGKPAAAKAPSLGDQSPAFFQTGQGGRTVLPPLASAFPISPFSASGQYPNQFTQPRSMPRYDYNNPALYNNQWPYSNQSSTQNYSYYDPTYYSNMRASPTNAMQEPNVDSRKLPPLNTSSAVGRDDRWSSSNPSYSLGPTNVPSNSGIRSPTASYPSAFSGYPQTNTTSNYGYVPMTDQVHGTNNPSMMMPGHRSISPSYTSSSASIHPSSYTPPPVSPTSGTVSEPTIKKKRKRADATQLKVLNETYARTAFPSTEERQALAKLLDMSARSVQIWFQNKRQSMRQTRQSSSSASTLHGSFGMSSHGDTGMDDQGHSASGYDSNGMQIPSGSYMPRSSHESRSSPDVSPSTSHRRPRQDAVSGDSKWQTRY
ncbi:hypothetical protein D9757_000784 [Collybiopsis confluens]|uniref:Homeobox domain-containing protein n=1 Tax=Collybiopsis confluens TaxID=2823264 RepID=A0A8H5MGF2_9AGAR|nr:hypothetical protein D9757_000784 [Collybiopsis confluens]